MARSTGTSGLSGTGRGRSARRCARVSGKDGAARWLDELETRPRRGLETVWGAKRKAYLDSIHRDGAQSDSICQHNSMLAVLFDLVPQGAKRALVRHLKDPPVEMVKVGPSFAMLYLYEALEWLGEDEATVESIREKYSPMVEAGSTTVWEVFAENEANKCLKGFPTRSHCHG